MMYCTKCGVSVQEGAGFCRSCGQAVVSAPGTPGEIAAIPVPPPFTLPIEAGIPPVALPPAGSYAAPMVTAANGRAVSYAGFGCGWSPI